MRLLLAAVLALVALPAMAQAQQVTVYAAASMTSALQEIGRLWQARGNPAPRYSFASSSVLARQIEQGAQADIFVSADEPWMDYLAERKLIVAETRRSPIGNRLVFIAPADKPLSFEVTPGMDLAALLGSGRLVTGDPAHVPVGKYAQAALEKLGLWATAASRLARADNVRAALALVERGEAPLGIVYATDAAITPKVKVAAAFPAGSHPPITYPFAILKERDTPAVRALYVFLLGEEAKAVYMKYGFATE